MALTSCDDDTAMIGSGMMPGNDNISTSNAQYSLTSRSLQVDSVLANTTHSYLGSIVDPETQAKTTCGFLAQFHMMENFRFPEKDRILCDEQGNAVADSCDIRIFFDEYYGDSLAVMKLHVQELDTARVMNENTAYYTNLKPEDFIDPANANHFTYTYAVKDFTRTNVTNPSVVVRLPKEYGSYILNKYYENPDFFKNSYQFIHHVCPGFYFRTTGSEGSMINSYISTLDVFFRYKSKTELGTDTIMDGMHRMAATEEVIQNTHVENKIPDWMLDESNGYTYLKSPTGIFTEVTLPLADVVAGSHYTDTINSAQVVFRCFNAEFEDAQLLSKPAHVLMVRKQDMFGFFEKEQLPDSKTSFIAAYDTQYNAYVFSNIGQLLTQLKDERDAGAGVQKSEPEALRNEKYAVWEQAHPDWNKVVLIPVNAEYVSSTSIYGTTTQVLQRVRNQMGLSSVRLEGGTGESLQMSVVYSRFKE